MKFLFNNIWRIIGECMRNLNKKSVNPFLWFIFAIVIPVIIIISLTVLVLAIAGFDVSGWTKDKASNIPIVSSFITTEEEKKDRKSTRLNSSHVAISYAVFCLKKKKEERRQLYKEIIN